ncbi:leucine--tRNA ligase [Caldivirga maquilingensis]|uniref:Leucine--tRNA ligase n=1 Tax=Caldivirga maquilingensis (strain ATCC 700844 / DSM 13496 / JCM 10307 / IC-167) TaxID=397948 RepID=A8MBP3_CALMQ|nr:leucine--tRNA ligase [Caldivirga maquilingensis]ABW02776.1 leucyl-tRNA synthetase [Caldivirga maquilingensis IC-167]
MAEKWQEEWYSNGVFNANPSNSRPKFFITVPYPYIEGPPHMGHGRTFTVGDVVARFKRMMGYNVLFPIAFHITGTPIQAVADRLSKGDVEYENRLRREVNMYVKDPVKASEIVNGFKDPWNIVNFFKGTYINDFKSIGYSMDFRRIFMTGDPHYSSFIIWQYVKLASKGYLVRGRHQVLYAPDENQAVGEHDIRGGDELKIDILQFNLLKFKLNDSYLVAATLRPETIYGATNVWVNPDSIYVEAIVNGERWIISKAAAWKLQYQDKDVKVLREFKGSELVGKFVESPIGVKLPILPASFVDDDTATGVVYSVPAHAPYDYAALMDLKSNDELLRRYGIESIVKAIEPISIIKLPGFSKYPARDVIEKLNVKNQNDRERLDEATSIVYREEYYNGVMGDNTPFNGVKVNDARVKVTEELRGRGLLDVMYEIEPRRVYTRGGSRVIVAVIKDQWFLNFGDPTWKSLMLKALDNMKIIPEEYRQNFKATLDWLNMRPCARKRGLGTRMPWDPDWVIESLSDSTIYMAFYTIAHKLNETGLAVKLGELAKRVIETKAEDSIALNKLVSFYDYVFLGQGDPETIAKSLGVDKSIIEGIRAEFEYWYPVDQRHSGIDLISNHLSFFIAHHAAIFPERHWPRAISVNNYVIREGRRMSKSLGNVIYLKEAVEQYSPDLVRLYVSYSADLDNVMDWRSDEVDTVLSRLMDIWNTAQVIVSMGEETKEPSNPTIPTKWLLSILNRTITEGAKALEEMRIRQFALMVFFNLYDAVRVYMTLMDELPKDEVRYTLWKVLDAWVRMMQPITPHMAEEIWHSMGKSTYVSTERWPTVEQQYINDDVENAFKVVERLIDDIREVIRVRGQVGAVNIYVGPPDYVYDIFNEAIEMMDRGIAVKDVIRNLASKYKGKGEVVARIVNDIADGKLPRFKLSRDMEMSVMHSFKSYIERRLGIKVTIQDAVAPINDPANRARLSLPGRPAIYIEPTYTNIY